MKKGKVIRESGRGRIALGLLFVCLFVFTSLILIINIFGLRIEEDGFCCQDSFLVLRGTANDIGIGILEHTTFEKIIIFLPNQFHRSFHRYCWEDQSQTPRSPN